MPRSLISSSEFGARSHSARSTSMNSRPMIGVTSNALKGSRAPLSCSGSRWLTSSFGNSSISADCPLFFPFSCVEGFSALLTFSTTVVVVSVADGAMLQNPLSTMDVVAMDSGRILDENKDQASHLRSKKGGICSCGYEGGSYSLYRLQIKLCAHVAPIHGGDDRAICCKPIHSWLLATPWSSDPYAIRDSSGP